MSDKDRVSAYYLGRLDQNQETHEALGWESAEAQEARFSVLLDAVPRGPYTLLDVGSGLGDLYGFLMRHRQEVSYVGVDILPQMVDRARERHPGARFECLDILSDSGWSRDFDVVYASGIFNLRMQDNMGFVSRALRRFSEIANAICVVNFLSESSPDKEELYFYYSREATATLFGGHFERVELIEGYLENDFTIVARH